MSDMPRFEHRVLTSGEHCVTSPDVKGLCAVADTEAEARDEAFALLQWFREHKRPIVARTARVKHEAA